jgi:hypothetical protein
LRAEVEAEAKRRLRVRGLSALAVFAVTAPHRLAALTTSPRENGER